MTKLCSVCGTENRDEAQFCRACGTAFATAAAAASGAAASAANVCAECGFQNKPGIRYCANCGMSLATPSAEAGATADIPGNSDFAGLGPPPISYPSFATVAPYPPAPTDHSALFEDRLPPDIPDPDAEIALRQQHAQEDAPGETTVSFQNPAPPNRAPLIVGVVVAALAVAGVAAWLFMGKSDPSPARPGAASAPVVTAPAVAPSAAAVPSPIIIEEASPPSAAATSAAPRETPAPAATAGALGTPPATAPPLPQLGDPAVESAEAEAKRVAAEKKREKAARDKAEREAKAKAASEPRAATVATPTAAQRAEQEAQARKRTEDAQRARPSTAATLSPPVVAQPRGVREICAGRGLIAEAVCQSRQCGLPEHANEAVCRQLREQDDRRRNYQN